MEYGKVVSELRFNKDEADIPLEGVCSMVDVCVWGGGGEGFKYIVLVVCQVVAE